MSKKYNQIKQKIIHSYGKKDEPELIKIAGYLIRKHKLIVKREWFMLFDKETGEYMDLVEMILRNEINKYHFHPPDLSIIIPGQAKPFVIEIDGSIHTCKTVSTERRNKRYVMAKVPHLTFFSGTTPRYIADKLAKLGIIQSTF